ncbi:glycoside hydrolase family 2 protein [Allobaculum sp. JKK-2023]|uniref:glycoside hydrolase family 2 protein n=1 Tax=Allobaculum sp. JKK-2023 TaxID=3108943 RepID=UPI002B056226|nr:glycoside hydrolase family 2 TIM barrel-domain containing protein [Allobaculum sp. JKK-2023]
MRETFNFNDGWQFSQVKPENYSVAPEASVVVDLPHTWNKFDGQDGGADYARETFYYTKELPAFERKADSRVYLEFEGANSAANVYVNGKLAGRHEGGYSTFRFDITDLLNTGFGEANVIVAEVDNSTNHIYPQTADFTFYGGLYRNVNLLVVEPSHFDLDFYGGNGIAIDTNIHGSDADVNVKAYITNPKEISRLEVKVLDADGNVVAQTTVPAQEENTLTLTIENVHLWNGVKDPYLYTVECSLLENNETVDEVSIRIGVREFYVDPQKGFFLNGVLTPLRGVSRHQDRLGKGNALDFEDHLEDARLIKELGANTIRLAHYQHAQDFYDLCDELGFVLWAEIPMISAMIAGPEAEENAKEQMKELIVQNYNHPSIVTWGISNEITIAGESDELLRQLNGLNDLVHEMDKTRLTTMAQVSMLPKTSPHNQLTDILSYNHYFGWYGGEFTGNEAWVDKFHEEYPDRALGLSEYGCEGIITYHGDNPHRGDYSEEYQAAYHEHMARIIDERPWLWATHVWNMFDFGVDTRDEGGVKGRNNKGLVTFDRKTKKDAFYIYQAYWTDQPVLHITSKRFRKRATDTIEIKVYTNLEGEVALMKDGAVIAALPAQKVVVFKDVALTEGENKFTVKAGNMTDEVIFEKVDQPEESYIFVDPDGGAVTNWFDTLDLDEVETVTEINPDFYSLEDTIDTLLDNEASTEILANGLSSLSNMPMKVTMLKMFGTKKVTDLLAMMGGFSGEVITPEKQALIDKKVNYMNAELQKVKK